MTLLAWNFLPDQYFWLQPVLIAVAIVFVVDLIGNLITFNNRILNALVTAVIFGILLGAVMYVGYADLRIQGVPT